MKPQPKDPQDVQDDIAPLSEVRFAEQLEAGYPGAAPMSKGDRTRFRLRIAAAAAMEAQGYNDLKVADICTGAGVALGTFYVYFRDKSDIAIDVVMSFMERLYQEVRTQSHGQDDYRTIYLSNLYFVRAYRCNPGLMQCMVQLQSHETAFREIWTPRHRNWIEALAKSIRRRAGVSEDRGMQIAAALEAMVFNYLYNTIVTHEWDVSATAEEIAEMLSVLWYRSVYARDPAGVAISA